MRSRLHGHMRQHVRANIHSPLPHPPDPNAFPTRGWVVGGWGALVITILLSMAGSPCMLLRQIWRTGNQAEARTTHDTTNVVMQCLCDPSMQMEVLAFAGLSRVDYSDQFVVTKQWLSCLVVECHCRWSVVVFAVWTLWVVHV